MDKDLGKTKVPAHAERENERIQTSMVLGWLRFESNGWTRKSRVDLRYATAAK